MLVFACTLSFLFAKRMRGNPDTSGDAHVPVEQSGKDQQNQDEKKQEHSNAMVEIPAPAHAQPVFWQSIEIPAGNLVVDRNWRGGCQDNNGDEKDRGGATQPPREKLLSPD